ncbi:MAG: glycosyltransferase family 2 protein [Alphaproteobacteria bacterium]
MSASLFIAVCTFDRPALLRRCLRSILPQLPAHGGAAWLAVIDNDPAGSARPVVEEESAASGQVIQYAVEPEIGIPHARNRAADLCLEAKADWLVFIDDDALAGPGWIGALLSAVSEYSADAIAGPVEMPLPDPVPFWAIPADAESPGEGAVIKVACTNNVAIRSGVFREHPALRFDTAMRFTGGSDADFFRRLVAAGGTIRWSERLRVSEPLTRERLTFRWQMARQFRIACNKLYSYSKLRPVPALYARRFLRAVWFLFSGSAVFLGGMMLLPLGPKRFRKPVLGAALHVSWALGTFAGLMGCSAQPYRPDRIVAREAVVQD